MQFTMSMKKIVLILICCVLLVTGLALAGGCSKDTTQVQSSTPTATQPTTTVEEIPQMTLRFATFDTPTSFTSAAHQAWADELTKRTNGKIKVEISWGGAMGQMPEHYDLVETGVADVGYFLPMMSPGLFPISDITELPWILTDYGVSVRSTWELYKQGFMDKEYANVKVLFAWSGAQTTQFSTMPIKTLADLKGKKLSGAPEEQALALGAVPVTIGLPEMYSALDKGVIDAQWVPFVSVPGFRIHEVTKYANVPVYGNPVCTIAMNKDVWNKMPDSVKKIIDSLTDEVLIPMTIQGYVETGAEGEKLFADAGGVVTKWSDSDIAEMGRLLTPVWEKWITEREGRGYDAKAAVEAFWSMLKKEGVAQPAVGFEPGK